ncbi:MAG TPA: outer membrane beta-barrel protein [Steroidobacteraceae bacterium]|nr:outer membrane beta-barrel protein [Steroidobacteraceae bacterium]
MTGPHRAAALAAALGLILAGTAAADSETGFYFGLTGGTTSVDLGSKQDYDTTLAPAAALFVLANGFDVVGIESSLDDSDLGWQLQIGYRFNRYVAAEVGYVDLGEAKYEAIITADDGVATFPVEASVRFMSSGPTAAVVGMLPLGERFDVHAKAGILFADTRLRSRVRDVDFADNVLHSEVHAGEKEMFLGIGGAWNIGENYSVRLEYQRFLDVGEDDSESDVDMVGLSLLFR